MQRLNTAVVLACTAAPQVSLRNRVLILFGECCAALRAHLSMYACCARHPCLLSWALQTAVAAARACC